MAGFPSCWRAVSQSVGLALIVLGEGGALAQTAPATGSPAQPGPPSTADAPAVAPPAGASEAAATPAPSANAGATSASKGAVMGYAYKSSATPAYASASSAPRHRHLLPHHPNEAVATFTGFEMLADGGSRLFVQLSRHVDVGQEQGKLDAAPAARKGRKTQAAAGADGKGAQVVSRLKFVLKGAEVLNPMNEGALVTAHFNTPVVRARLVPSGHDLDLVVDLRADVVPQMKVVAAKDNGAMLQVDFPQGSYLPAGANDPPPGANGATPSSFPAAAGPPAGASDSMGAKP